jgi:hypothetical protein
LTIVVVWAFALPVRGKLLTIFTSWPLAASGFSDGAPQARTNKTERNPIEAGRAFFNGLLLCE